MGKSARTMAVLLEGALKVLFSVFQVSTLLVLKVIRQSPKKRIAPTSHPLLLQSATELAAKIRRREVKSKEVVQAFINRIEEINPTLNFLVDQRFSAALKEAEKVDDILSLTTKTEKELEDNTPFLGVPCTIKESLAVKGLRHTSGLHSRKDVIATEDAPVVAAIRNAGAIPLGVTNTPELCCWWETFNPLYGCTYNPYNTNHTPGGSSGGEGSVIAAAGSLFGLGSDFAGSIRIPACFNGVFGHRPTSETTSHAGHYPVPANVELKPLLVTGPLVRYARDLRPIMKIITKDLAPDLNLDTPVDLRSLKVYYMEEGRNMFLSTAVQPSIKAAVRRTAHHFQTLGAKVEKLRLDRMKYAMLYWYAKIKTSDGPQLGIELANHKGAVSMTAEFFKSIFGASKHTFPVILFGVLEAGNGISYKGTLHSAVLNEYQLFQQEMKTILDEKSVLILPTHPTTAPRHKEAVARAFDIGYGAVFNVLGYPATACPVTRDDMGLPVGVQVVANNRQDRLTIAVAEEIERAFGGWTPPYS